MASNQTPNLQLCQWEADDEVLRVDFNADNAKIDTAIAALAGLPAYCGNCIVVTGTYIGTGSCGAGSPSVLTFPYKPMLVLLEEDFLLRQGVEATRVPFGSSTQRLEVRWEGNSVSWYSYNGYAQYQCNIAGMTYHYVAFLVREEEDESMAGEYTAP